MHFDIAEFIRQNHFSQTREGDKRDIFEKDYFHPFENKHCKVCVTIHYDSGYSQFNSYSIWLLTIELVSIEDRQVVFKGIAPSTFDEAASLFELILPTKEYLQRKEL
jgi:hypothetical protein